jgi:hypothetical protein
VQRTPKILKAERANLALTAIGDGKIRLNSASFDYPKTILPAEALLIWSEGKSVFATRVRRAPSCRGWPIEKAGEPPRTIGPDLGEEAESSSRL